MKNICKLMVLFIGNLVFLPKALAQLPPQWVWSTYEAESPVEQSVVITEVFHYTESVYKPGELLKAVSKKQKANSGPEEAFISRMSAIVAGDYDWWLETWDESSRKLVLEKNKASGHDKKFWLEQWKEQFSNRKIVPVRKIETGKDYVIITYKIFTEDGKEASSGFELPSILKRINGKWYSTLDLKSDALPIASPWVSGKDEVVSKIF